MIEWYKKVVFENYANFKGRARRSEYWYFLLMNMIFAIIAMIIDKTSGMNIAPLPYGYVYLAYVLSTLLPGLAAAVRRLHDIGKSGWYLLLSFIPLVGSIWILVLLCKDGDSGTNEYGSDPKNSFEEINEIGQTE